MAIPYQTKIEFEYGRPDKISPLVRRVIANNPGPFTFTGTGTYLVGTGEVAVIDPGPKLDDHIQAILAALEPSERISHIFITHTHNDHSPAAEPLKALTGAVICGFAPLPQEHHHDGPQMEEAVDESYAPDMILHDGDIIHGKTWSLEAVHTPGHMSNHLCYALHQEQTLFTGDHVMGWATSVVAPPDGNMHAYMQSLDRLLARQDKRYLPTHGPEISDPQNFVKAYIEHRRNRERQIVEQLAQGERLIPEIVAILYKDVDKRLHPAAALSVLAHLEDLQAQGRVICTDGERLSGRYSLISA